MPPATPLPPTVRPDVAEPSWLVQIRVPEEYKSLAPADAAERIMTHFFEQLTRLKEHEWFERLSLASLMPRLSMFVIQGGEQDVDALKQHLQQAGLGSVAVNGRISVSRGRPSSAAGSYRSAPL